MKRHAKQLMATPHPASRLGLRSNAIKEISKADKLTTVNPIATTPLTTNHPAPNAIRESPKPTSASRFRRTSTSRPTMALALGASCGLMFSMDGTARIRSHNGGCGRHRPHRGLKVNSTLIVWKHKKCAKTSKVTRRSRTLRPRLVGGVNAASLCRDKE